MTDKERMILRHTAHEIIIKLFNANQIESLKLLKLHCERALIELNKEQPNEQR